VAQPVCFWLWEIPVAWCSRDISIWDPGSAWAVTIAFSTLAVGQRGAVPARALEAQSGINLRAMRFLRVVLALVFGLAMAGQDTLACSHHRRCTHKGNARQRSSKLCPRA